MWYNESKQIARTGTSKVIFGYNGRDGAVTIDYSSSINENTAISASISLAADVSISAGYTITTKDNYGNAVSTGIDLSYKATKQDLITFSPQAKPEDNPASNPTHGSASSSASISENDYGWGDLGRDILNGVEIFAKCVAVSAGVVVGACAIIDDVTPVGAFDNIILLPVSYFLVNLGN